MQGSGSRVWVHGVEFFRVEDSGMRVEDSGFRV